jgi:hypothetical protein
VSDARPDTAAAVAPSAGLDAGARAAVGHLADRLRALPPESMLLLAALLLEALGEARTTTPAGAVDAAA